MTRPVFISYRSLDRAFASRLQRQLERSGIPVWIDIHGIRAGDNWIESIKRAIDDSSLLIVIECPQYYESKNCIRELVYADQLNKPLIPICIREVLPEVRGMYIPEKQSLDFREWHTPSAFQTSMDKLIRAIKSIETFDQIIVENAEIRYLKEMITRYDDIELSYDLPVRIDTADTLNQPITFTLENPLPIERGLILSEPAMGKTTILRKIAVYLAKKRLLESHLAPIPIILDLKNWPNRQVSLGDGKFESRPVAAIQFIIDSSGWDFDGYDLEHLLSQGMAVLLIDGLNEVGTDSLAQARLNELRQLIYREHPIRYIFMACRLRDYSASLNMGFSSQETLFIDPLSLEQIKEIAMQVLDSEQVHLFLKQLQNEGGNNPRSRRLINLASNTYYLITLCKMYADDPTRPLPNQASDIIRKLVEGMWLRTAPIRHFQKLEIDESDLKGRIGKLAFELVLHSQSSGASLSWVIENLTERLTVQQLITRVKQHLKRDIHSKNLYEERIQETTALIGAVVDAGMFIFEGDKLQFANVMLMDFFVGVHLQTVSLTKIIETPRLHPTLRSRAETKWDVPLSYMLEADVSKLPERLRQIASIDPFFCAAWIQNRDNLPVEVLTQICNKMFNFLKKDFANYHDLAKQGLILMGGHGQDILLTFAENSQSDLQIRMFCSDILALVGDQNAANRLAILGETAEIINPDLVTAKSEYGALQQFADRTPGVTGKRIVGTILILAPHIIKLIINSKNPTPNAYGGYSSGFNQNNVWRRLQEHSTISNQWAIVAKDHGWESLGPDDIVKVMNDIKSKIDEMTGVTEKRQKELRAHFAHSAKWILTRLTNDLVD